MATRAAVRTLAAAVMMAAAMMSPRDGTTVGEAGLSRRSLWRPLSHAAAATGGSPPPVRSRKSRRPASTFLARAARAEAAARSSERWDGERWDGERAVAVEVVAAAQKVRALEEEQEQ